ncbi:hypothetical protein [Brevibacillus nitrificans]|uniref:hypothetical protein n=1 Tax=Brevibacillus nitrificans TaxID=651560 RepID=UPI00262C5161|nr:hypothetical protein [Brevibacillus nitrificans]
MKRSLLLLCMLLALIMPTNALAHITNEQNLYEDLQYSEAKAQIVYLSGLGVIAADHGTALFSPKEKLTRADLAYWAGSFFKLAGKEAKHEEIAQAAVAKGLVSSLDGNATYEDVNLAYLQGKVQVEKAKDEVTREAFAQFVYEHRGKTLYEQAGFSQGPVGKVDKVTSLEEKDAAGNSTKSYIVKIADQPYKITAHPKIVQAPVDPTEWEGRTIEESWMVSSDGSQEKQLQLIQFTKSTEQAQQAASQPADNDHANHANHGQTDPAGQEEGAGFPFVPVILVVLLVGIVGALLFGRKKKIAAKEEA